MNNCIFCKILNGDIPCYKIYEDEYTLAFLDINPEGVGHTLVIPKEHFKDYTDIPIEVLSHINETGKKVFKLLDERLRPDGIRLLQNNGILQDVPHYHLHFIPVYKNDKELDVEKVYEILTKK